MDAIDRRLAELGEALDLARTILAEPEIRQGLADPDRALASGSAILRIISFGLTA